MSHPKPTFHQFFAGGGMAEIGLGPRWRCTFSNDICEKKARAYRANFPKSRHYLVRDVAELTTADLPGRPTLVWASFPCQDLSLAGQGRGLNGARSGTFWPFWRLMEAMRAEGRAAPIVVLENVVGAITSHGGRDFAAILEAMRATGYRFGAMVIDAVHFVPQSRPRLFIVGLSDKIGEVDTYKLWHSRPRLWLEAESAARADSTLRGQLVRQSSAEAGPRLRATVAGLPARLRESWIEMALPSPPPHRPTLEDCLERDSPMVNWNSRDETSRLIAMMTDTNRHKLERARASGRRVVGAAFRRTRRDALGRAVQRLEIRFDGQAGCLRTPAGGSSRQIVIEIDGERVRTRLMTPRETARLMGLSDDYRLPDNANEAYHLIGDGVVVPVVAHLERHLLRPPACASGERSSDVAWASRP